MADSIETFVAKLQTEGVQAGQDAAEKIKADADAQAQQIISKAQADAEKIIADAKSQADATLAKSQGELALAARDAVLRLQETLNRALRAVLAGPVNDQLSQSDFIRSLLPDIILQYARADSEQAKDIKINVSPDHQRQLADWAINELHKAAQTDAGHFDLQGTLAQAGFEYKTAAGTVEVTVNSVVETLAEMVVPELRKLLDRAISDSDK